eukprot:sb/3466401/
MSTPRRTLKTIRTTKIQKSNIIEEQHQKKTELRGRCRFPEADFERIMEVVASMVSDEKMTEEFTDQTEVGIEPFMEFLEMTCQEKLSQHALMVIARVYGVPLHPKITYDLVLRLSKEQLSKVDFDRYDELLLALNQALEDVDNGLLEPSEVYRFPEADFERIMEVVATMVSDEKMTEEFTDQTEVGIEPFMEFLEMTCQEKLSQHALMVIARVYGVPLHPKITYDLVLRLSKEQVNTFKNLDTGHDHLYFQLSKVDFDRYDELLLALNQALEDVDNGLLEPSEVYRFLNALFNCIFSDCCLCIYFMNLKSRNRKMGCTFWNWDGINKVLELFNYDGKIRLT